jgi:aspartyl-tRNA(Asn)/glutamyl-tRNA(Gln) amidotransferase subunit A
MSDIAFMSVPELAAAIRAGKISAVDVVEANAKQIEKFNSDHNIFTLPLVDEARARAKDLDADAARGVFHGPLHGVTLAVKDAIDVAGYRNTYGTISRVDSPPAPRNASVVQSLVDAGANIIGLANLHELCYGGTSNNPWFGPVRNMWDPARMPGGSSGGSAVSVSSGCSAIAIGTDTGGSVRIPASVTGTAALKVTIDKFSTSGVMPLTWTLDTVGPMGRRVEDLFEAYAAMSGEPARRPSDAPRFADPSQIVVGIDRAYYLEQGRMEPGIYDGFIKAMDQLAGLRIKIVDVSIPLLQQASAAQYAIVLGEASAAFSGPLRAERPKYSPESQGYLALGDTLLAQDYLAALRFRQELWDQMRDVFETVDFLIAPGTPHAASLIEQSEFNWPDGTTESLLDACWRYTFPSNLVGIPTTCQPCGVTPEGLPVGFQLIGRPNSEWPLLATAGMLERELAWDFRAPVTKA